ncbi:Cystathionine beta-lyase [Pseudonocardia dioxanivorans CB1190]|uniref:cysteine-S-conjugate beta-lyase n=1 Tax=Pseudonocardia dioxanivorans (strain ATCC 55486 / DSM 44775 / JCM 13855 / CB1190) TaxID=675635 RepID=F4CQI2_PSEUX|nr:aminotransferase class I/II-fold pyridoxal phosphate-dependent enzyme [Pseudonocardia dioxanivorans]AEA22580.1 Cystathionine beta-lyase [Pseudonocardia dioxanivorans CB1190]GJF07606.1 aminotransferase [Pseudonocardia sp. D17]
MTSDPLFDDLDLADVARRPGIKWRAAGAGVVAAWVADMDFAPPAEVTDAIVDVVRAGDLGYPEWLTTGTPLRAAFADRMADRFGWTFPADEVREHTDLIQGLQLVLHLGSSPGDGVAVHTPGYPPFLATIEAMARKRFDVPFRLTEHGWDPNLPALDEIARSCRVLVLVNPHNPTGRVLTCDELTEIAAIARRHDLLVVSDEIHAELVHDPYEHVPFASLGADAAARTVTLTSASKAFNLAGLHCAVGHWGPPTLRGVRDAHPSSLFGEVSSLSVAATLAAWAHGDDWQRRLRVVLRRNRDRVATWLAGLGGDDPVPEATYLYWFDAALLGLTGPDPVADARRDAGVRLEGGPGFGTGSSGRLRLNFATAAPILDEIQRRLEALRA